MSIASQITRIQSAKEALKTSINAKGGTLTTERLDAYASAVDNLSSGGEPDHTGQFLVRFIDIDGAVLKEQWVDSGQDATPPTPPTKDLLTFAEWNNTYTNITYEKNIGAIYDTIDGKTYIGIALTMVKPLRSPVLYFKKSDASTLSVDWGDGAVVETSTVSGAGSLSHTYATSSNFVISMWISSGIGNFILGQETSTTNTVLAPSTTFTYQKAVYFIYCGSSVYFRRYNSAFSYYSNISCFSVSRTTIMDSTAPTVVIFDTTYPVQINFPSGVSQFCNPSCQYYICIPSNYSSLNSWVWPKAQTAIVIPPNSVIGFGSFLSSVGSENSSVKSVSIWLPSGITGAPGCFFMKKIIKTGECSGTMIGDAAQSIEIIDLAGTPSAAIGKVSSSAVAHPHLKSIIVRHTSVASLSSDISNGIAVNTKIYVPDNLVDSYKVATNWSVCADKIFPISIYVEENYD